MVLVERDEEIAALEGLLASAVMGRGRIALVGGAVATGKSALLHAFAEQALEHGALPVTATGSRMERDLPFGVLGQLVRDAPLVRGERERAAALLEEGARSAPASGPAADTLQQVDARIVDGLCGILLGLSERYPLLVVVDDVDQADRASLLCLAYLSRRLRVSRILAVFGCSDQGGPDEFFETEVLRQPHCRRLRLAPLSPVGVVSHVARLVDCDAAERLGEQWHTASGGNPLLVGALADDYRDAVRASGGVPPGTLVTGERYTAAVLACLHRAAPSTLRAARALAVLGGPDLLSGLLGVGPADVMRELHALTSCGLVERGRFRHEAARAAVLAELAAPDRAGLYRRAAQLAHDAGAAPEVVARHLVDAGTADLPWAVPVLVEAAECALRAGRARPAADYLRLAWRACDDERRLRIGMLLVAAEWRLDPGTPAAQLGHQGDAARRGGLRGSDAVVLARALLWHGRFDDARDVLARVERAAAAPAPHGTGPATAAPSATAPPSTGAASLGAASPSGAADSGWAAPSETAAPSTAADMETTVELAVTRLWLRATHPPFLENLLGGEACAVDSSGPHSSGPHTPERYLPGPHGAGPHVAEPHPSGPYEGGDPGHASSALVPAPLGNSVRAPLRPPLPALSPSALRRLESARALSDTLSHGSRDGDVEAVERVLQASRLGHAATDAATDTVESALLALAYGGHSDRAASWWDLLTGEAPPAQAPSRLARLAAVRAEIAIRQGDMPGAEHHARAALAAVPPASWGVTVGGPLGSLVLAQTAMGRYDAAREHLDQPVGEAVFQTRYGLQYLHARGRYGMAAGLPALALRDFQLCGELMTSWDLDAPGLVPWRAEAAEALLRMGRPDQARLLVEAQLARCGPDSPRERGVATRLLAAVSDLHQRPVLLRQAVDLLQEAGDRYELARALCDFVDACNALGENRRAALIATRAHAMAVECRADPLTLALPSRPEPIHVPAPPSPEPVEVLSDAERRVAALAAAGYTNREIAGKLYITISTVEQHLTRTYRKLNISKRADLPSSLEFGDHAVA
ncbi:hypothetical protein GCM10009530_35270 [Microbispora corallina]|uniref:AAA family ATPase n=1 Tax=Microbispora corallina TaxID=83302 RepID=UPI0031DD083B